MGAQSVATIRRSSRHLGTLGKSRVQKQRNSETKVAMDKAFKSRRTFGFSLKGLLLGPRKVDKITTILIRITYNFLRFHYIDEILR